MRENLLQKNTRDAERGKLLQENTRDDQMIEKAAGRKMTDKERAGIMRRIAAKLREKAMKARGK